LKQDHNHTTELFHQFALVSLIFLYRTLVFSETLGYKVNALTQTNSIKKNISTLIDFYSKTVNEINTFRIDYSFFEYFNHRCVTDLDDFSELCEEYSVDNRNEEDLMLDYLREESLKAQRY
ncbi:MAG: hypothetical protein HAW67_05795, partial [Endozoicomonadaceae bacterium]|nr:hypothetical protein [Endozoicomonadaceae bacterium]